MAADDPRTPAQRAQTQEAARRGLKVDADTLSAELGVPVCISSDISPQIREYPRMITTACNAATMPVIGPYLDELQYRLSTWADRDVQAVAGTGELFGRLTEGGACGRHGLRRESGGDGGAMSSRGAGRRQSWRVRVGVGEEGVLAEGGETANGLGGREESVRKEGAGSQRSCPASSTLKPSVLLPKLLAV